MAEQVGWPITENENNFQVTQDRKLAKINAAKKFCVKSKKFFLPFSYETDNNS